ncbi:integrator complex subunit 7 [Teleopsis dalmanni]|uniref:integrator complex subunit 7 n=1 Tax=Teleopsis dalmanni TaxID=139649 RepID=UPI0018CEEA96|nr:integrator complex subunit 7 [Teleopsis dalmanni]
MASLTGVRVNLFNENFQNDTEQDANLVLMELDKGLRSSKLAIQCEAIVRFPRLFEKYPFPILISSSFLKLSEFFLTGTNLLKFWVLRVCQQSENHLDKIMNIDAFVKRIFTVMHSNDPVGRALTLRTLGAISRVIAERPQVHHAIRRALDSHDKVEVEAAIYASGQFAAQSKSFAVSICLKISDMIESIQIPVPMKLQLIPVLRHMHHDANTAGLVKELCRNLLLKFSAKEFVIAILDSLTQLSARTLTGVPDQVNLLLNFLQDARKPVRGQALQSLISLTDAQTVTAWPMPVIEKLILKAKACEDEKEQYFYLHIIYKLCESPLMCQFLLEEHKQIVVELCTECIGLREYTTASEGFAILAALIEFSGTDQERVESLLNIVNITIDGIFLFATSDVKNLRKILINAIKVASVNEEFGIRLVELVTDIISGDVNCPVSNIEIFCQSLAELCTQFQLKKFAPQLPVENAMETDAPKPIKINPVLERLSLILQKLSLILDDSANSENSHTIEILGAVIMQSMMGGFPPAEVIKVLERFENTNTNYWSFYRLGRSASRYGQHYIAAFLLSKALQYTIADRFQFYIKGLIQMSEAECVLNTGFVYKYINENYTKCDPRSRLHDESVKDVQPMTLMRRLESAIDLYWQSLSCFRASSSSSQPFVFQLEFLKLRAQFLQTLQMAVTVKNAQVIVPPPAIANSLAQNSGDYLQKYGHVTNQLRKLVKALKSCGESYNNLYKSAFNADPITLEFIEIAEYQCTFFAHIVENICYATPAEPPLFLINCKQPETRYFAITCQQMDLLQKHLPREEPNAKTISNRHLEVILALIELIMKRPLCLPRYFFQTLQSTQIKLSVSPQPRSPTEFVIVQSGSNLVIKIEGIIQHSGKKHTWHRSVDSVQLSLTAQLMSPRPIDNMKPISDTVTQSQIVKPQRDFLTGFFLLPISSGSQWQVTLETSAIDENGIVWNTGPKNSMLVRGLDDQTKASTSSSPSVPVGQTRRF